MINRVLIRIKVVQLLYSYLLTQSEFKIEPPVENPSRDKKYGYDLYLDLLILILELSGIDVTGGKGESPLRGLALNKHIDKNALAKSLNGNDEIRSLILRGRSGVGAFDSLIPSLYDGITKLPAYKSYIRKKKTELKDDVELWLSIVKNLMAENPEFVAVARNNPDFTLAGFNRGVESALHTLRDYNDNRALYNGARHALDHSLAKAHDLYFSLLALAVEITGIQDQRLDAARHKYLPTDEDLHPNLRFVENKFVKALAENEELATFIEQGKMSWDTDDMLVKALLESILSSEIYKEYMEKGDEPDFEADSNFWYKIFKSIILPSDELAEALENKSVYWNDDIHVMGTFVLKTIKQFARSKDEGRDTKLLPQYKDDEDSRFGPELFDLTVKNFAEYRQLIDKFVNEHRWDADRLAFMDIVIMVTAIAELLNFPSIPMAVTLNEYIEIANAYSTPKSGSFINGILYSVINYLRSEGKLFKA